MKNSIFLLSLLLSACSLQPRYSTSPAQGTTGIGGYVRDHAGNPAKGAQVYAYRSARSGLRGPADFAADVDITGNYFLDLAPGNYYLIARSRRTGAVGGQPRPGDAWANYPGNPVKVVEGQQKTADLKLASTGEAMPMKVEPLKTGTTGFTGRLLDQAGRGVAGAFVIAYRNGDRRRIPDATSPMVGDDGQFRLYLTEPGRWCLAARTRTRGQPAAGELFGVLAGGDGCRQIAVGEIKTIGSIVLTPHP